MEDLDKRIDEANEELFAEEEKTVAPETMSPVDVYQEQQKIQRDYAKKQFPRGSREQVLATVKDVIDGAGTASLARAYERARDDSEALDGMGDHRRAQLVRNQYMQERFLPAIEVVVNFTSPDELLNSKGALKELDKFALGKGSMSGYTEAYVREAYGNILGQTESASSPVIMHAVERVNGLLDTDQMVTAKGLARKMKHKIDEGEAIASEDDYQFLSTVANS